MKMPWFKAPSRSEIIRLQSQRKSQRQNLFAQICMIKLQISECLVSSTVCAWLNILPLRVKQHADQGTPKRKKSWGQGAEEIVEPPLYVIDLSWLFPQVVFVLLWILLTPKVEAPSSEQRSWCLVIARWPQFGSVMVRVENGSSDVAFGFRRFLWR